MTATDTTPTTRTLDALDAAVTLILERLDEHARALGLPTESERVQQAAEAAERAEREAQERAARDELRIERLRLDRDPEAHAAAVALTASLAAESAASRDAVLPLLQRITAHLQLAPHYGFNSSHARPARDDAEVNASRRALEERSIVLAHVALELGRSQESVADALGIDAAKVRSAVFASVPEVHRLRVPTRERHPEFGRLFATEVQ